MAREIDAKAGELMGEFIDLAAGIDPETFQRAAIATALLYAAINYFRHRVGNAGQLEAWLQGAIIDARDTPLIEGEAMPPPRSFRRLGAAHRLGLLGPETTSRMPGPERQASAE
jgi:hypothetical protein